MSRIYLVDDHTIMREGLRAMLEAGGHRVVGESAEPVQALEGIMTAVSAEKIIPTRAGKEHLDALLAGQCHQRAATAAIDITGRMLLAQAERHTLTLVTGDMHLQHCGVPWLW